MNRYDSPPFPLPEPIEGEAPFSRADLVFHDVDHSGLSYEGRIFLNAPDADENTPKETEAGYAGSFYIFGHWGCLGDEGHCDIPEGRLHAFDYRPLHKLVPYKQIVDVTPAIQRLVEGEAVNEVTVSVIPVAEPLLEDDDTSDLLHLSRLSLLTYE